MCHLIRYTAANCQTYRKQYCCKRVLWTIHGRIQDYRVEPHDVIAHIQNGNIRPDSFPRKARTYRHTVSKTSITIQNCCSCWDRSHTFSTARRFSKSWLFTTFRAKRLKEKRREKKKLVTDQNFKMVCSALTTWASKELCCKQFPSGELDRLWL
jgi:hypothetical protein